MQKTRLTLAGIAAGFTLLLGTAAQAQTLGDAKRQIEGENWKAARKTIATLIRNDPKDARPYFFMGKLLLETSTPDSAEAAFNRGIAVNDKEPLNYIGLAKVQFQRNKPTEAGANIDKALALSKRKNAYVLATAGETYLEAPVKHADKAINLLNEAVKLNPNDAEAHLLLGHAYLAKNDGGQAVKSFNRALQANPKLPQAHMMIGKIYGGSRNFPEAQKSLEKAIAIDSTFGPAHRELGELYYQANQLDKARNSYRTYLRLAGNDIQARGRYAGFLYLSKDFEKAVGYANEVLAQDPKNYIMLRVKGYSQYELEDYENALATMDQYFAIVPAEKQLASDYENYGNIQSKLGKTSEALASLTKALELDSARTSIHGNLAELHLKNRDYPAAAHHYRKRISSGQQITLQDYFALGQALYLGKQYQAADSAFAVIADKQPDLYMGHQWRGRALSGLDPELSKGLAREHYEKMIEKAGGDPAKNKQVLIEGYEYLAAYHYNKGEKAKAKMYYQKIKELDPRNAKANEMLKVM